MNRADEIRDWLLRPNVYFDRNFEWDVVSWVSLDDLNLAAWEKDIEMKDHHIQVDPLLGLCKTEGIVPGTVAKLQMWDIGIPSENGGVDNGRLNSKRPFELAPAPQWLEKQTLNCSFQKCLRKKLRVATHNDNSDDDNNLVLSASVWPQNSNGAMLDESSKHPIPGGKYKPMSIPKDNLYGGVGAFKENHRIPPMKINCYPPTIDSSPVPFELSSGHALNEQERTWATPHDRSLSCISKSRNLEVPPFRKYFNKPLKAPVKRANTAIGLLQTTGFGPGFPRLGVSADRILILAQVKDESIHKLRPFSLFPPL